MSKWESLSWDSLVLFKLNSVVQAVAALIYPLVLSCFRLYWCCKQKPERHWWEEGHKGSSSSRKEILSFPPILQAHGRSDGNTLSPEGSEPGKTWSLCGERQLCNDRANIKTVLEWSWSLNLTHPLLLSVVLICPRWKQSLILHVAYKSLLGVVVSGFYCQFCTPVFFRMLNMNIKNKICFPPWNYTILFLNCYI